MNVLVTQNGLFLGPINNLLGWILEVIYRFLSVFGIENAAICIILFTFIVKSMMIPLTIKQQKFSKISAKMNPELMKINAKYKGKRDEVSMRKQQAETNALYQKYGANPTSGCLPMLITLPIMFALYQVVYNIPAYISDINELYKSIAVGLQGSPNFIATFNEHFNVALKDTTTTNQIIDTLTKFDTSKWDELAKAFPSIRDVIVSNSDKIMHINSFIGGLNIADSPISRPMPGLIIPILAVATQWYSTKQLNDANGLDSSSPGAASMKAMTTFMPLFSGFICLSLPIGVGLYWVAGSAFQIIQQFFINKYFEKMDMDVLIAKSVEKASKKKKRFDYQAKLEEMAKQQTKTIGNKASTNVNSIEKKTVDNTKAIDNNSKNYKPGGIAERANMMKGKNSSGKGDK